MSAEAAAQTARRPVYEVEFYKTEDGDQPARRWMKEELTPTKRRAIGTAINRILGQEGVNVCKTEWGKALGSGLYEAPAPKGTTLDGLWGIPHNCRAGESVMGNKFSDFLEEVEAEARAEGPEALAELAAFDERYRLAHELMVRRREAGLTQAKLAKLTGVGQADISRIEGGRANPTVSTLAAMAHALGYGIGLVPLDARAASARGSVLSVAAAEQRSHTPAVT